MLERRRQTTDEIIKSLSILESSWKDAHAEAVISLMGSFTESTGYSRKDIEELLNVSEGTTSLDKKDLEERLTLIRLFLDCSKDLFMGQFKNMTGSTPGISFLRSKPDEFIQALWLMGLPEAIQHCLSRKYSWKDVMTERLKGGRGSAIQGQLRGRNLEDFVEKIIQQVFGPDGYDVRCQFVGASGRSKEKADFAIPSKDDPLILIEAKAYGATGSKQTDVIGDVNRIISEKRHDTHFFLVTDGITWRERVNDLRKLIALQNEGLISRIYTQSMQNQIVADLHAIVAL